MAVMLYATAPVLIYNLNDGLTNEEMAVAVSSMRSPRGATYTDFAFETGWRDVWEPVENDTDRVKVVLFVTDGKHTTDPVSRDPCEEAGKYIANGIQIVALVVDPETPLEHVLGEDCIYYPSILTYRSSVEDFADVIAGTLTTFAFNFDLTYDIDTPFNGFYENTGHVANGRPIFRSALHQTSSYNGSHWEFASPTGERMIELIGTSDNRYPPPTNDWIYFNTTGEPFTYRFLFITCLDVISRRFEPTAAPVISPSANPITTIPSSFPSLSPSLIPTLSPTQVVFYLESHLSLAKEVLNILADPSARFYFEVSDLQKIIEVTKLTVKESERFVSP